MSISIFTLCDCVQNYNGKIVIVGASNIIGVPSIPYMKIGMNVVARIIFDKEEEICHKFMMTIKKPSGKDLVSSMTFENKNNIAPNDNELTNIDLIVGINNVVFDEEGKYSVVLNTEQESFCMSFVVKVQQ